MKVIKTTAPLHYKNTHIPDTKPDPIIQNRQIWVQHHDTSYTIASHPPWKKLRWTQLGAFSCCEYPSPRADRSLWNLADVIEILGGDFCTWEDASAAGYTERIIRLFPMRETFLHEYFRRVTVARYERGLFPVKGHYSNLDSQRIYRRELSPV